jgi:radical SAM protein with 4Fe4S-binding SPASM domain
VRDPPSGDRARRAPVGSVFPRAEGRAGTERSFDVPRRDGEVLALGFEMDRLGAIRVRETSRTQAVRVWQAQGASRPTACGVIGWGRDSCSSLTRILAALRISRASQRRLRTHGFDVRRAYETSSVFRDLAQPDRYGGACGACAFRFDCGGCRARAYAATGDYLAAETSCPLSQKTGGGAG